jgi:hypothetical protein
MRQLLLGSMIASLTFFALACETPDDNNLESIRTCVDTASKLAVSNAAAAVSKAGECDTLASASTNQTKAMQEIRFGIILLLENKLTQIGLMAQSLKTSSGGRDGLTTVLSIMVFNYSPGTTAVPSSTDTTYASRISSYGNAVGGAAATLGNMIVLSTTLASFATITDSASALAALTSCSQPASTCDKTAVATAAYAMAQNACAAPSDQASTDPSNLCFKMKAAIGSNTPANPSALLASLAAYAATPH